MLLQMQIAALWPVADRETSIYAYGDAVGDSVAIYVRSTKENVEHNNNVDLMNESNITEETPLDYYEEHVWDIIDWFESEYGIVIQSDRIFTEIQTVGELTTYLKDLVDGKRY